MTEQNLEDTRPTQRSKPPLSERLRSNPVVLKELRSRMRGGRAFVVLTIYLTLVSALVGFVYISYSMTNESFYDPDIRQTMGKTIFGVVVIMQLALVSFIAPALTAGAISAERERKTYDLLRTTLLSARSLVSGKMLSALSFLFLLMLSALPLQSMAFLFGGVELPEFVISTIMLIVTAFIFSTIGLFFSSIIKRTLPSTVLAYAFSNILIFGLPLLFVILLTLLGPLLDSYFYYGIDPPDLLVEILLYSIGWVLVSINPLTAALASEVMLVEEDALVYTTLPMSGAYDFPIIAPWIVYCILFLVLSLFLYLLSIQFVKRKDR